MRFLTVLVVAVAWMQASAQGDAMISTPDSNDRDEGKRSPLSRQATDLDFNGDPSGATFVRNMLKVVFEMPEWRDLMVTFATPDELTDPEFRAKWNITKNDIAGFSHTQFPGEIRNKLRKVLKSTKWKGLIALSSSHKDLVNQNYRNKWGLGPLSNSVKFNSDSNNFFFGPQWYDFLAITGTRGYFESSQIRAKWLKKWLLSTMEMMSEL